MMYDNTFTEIICTQREFEYIAVSYRSYLSIYCNYEELKKVMYDMI